VRDRFGEVLVALEKSANIGASVIISNEGLLMASRMDPNLHPETFAAMTATVHNVAQMAMQTMGIGTAHRFIIEIGDGTQLVTIGAGSKALLTAFIRPDGNIGSSLVELQKTADTIKSILE